MRLNPYDLELMRELQKDPDILCLLEIDPEDPELSEEARKLLRVLQLVRQGACSRYGELSDASDEYYNTEGLNPYELLGKV